MSGIIMRDSNTHEFRVTRAPEKHAGKGRVLINYKRRDNAKRFEVVRIVTPTGLHASAAVIGHYDDPTLIKMDYDLRDVLGLREEEVVRLEITKTGFIGTVWWYLTVRDPLVRVPAILAVWSVAFGILSIFLAIIALF